MPLLVGVYLDKLAKQVLGLFSTNFKVHLTSFVQDILPLVIEKKEVSSSFSQVLEDLQVAVGGC